MDDNFQALFKWDGKSSTWDENGTAIRMVGAMTDITHRKEYEKSLRNLNDALEKRARELAVSNTELEQFAYVASHDLQEPLRMISSFMAQLEKKYADQLDDKARQYIHFAVDGAKRMRQIILDLLEYSRVGKHDDEYDSVDTGELLDEIVLLQRKNIQEHNAKVSWGKMPIIKSYRSPLVQIFQNLINNAIKYNREGVQPRIHLSCKPKKEQWEFKIEDNGIGIESEYFDKIFIIFQRLHQREEYSGTGMGLAIVKKIIETLGGEIWVESEKGRGSTFYFTLPRN